MEDQLKLMDEMDRKFSIGDEVKGEILSINNEEVIVSLVGYKVDGVIPFRELTNPNNLANVLSSLKVSDEIEAKVVRLKNEDGNVVLSRLEYERKEALKEIAALFESKENFKITVKEAKDRGLVAFFKGVRVFVPLSQIDTKFVNDASSLIGKELEVRLIDFSLESHSRVVASRRVILEEAKKIADDKAWENIKVGDITKAEIKRFTNFGAFASIYGIDGLIHLSQISWNHVKSAEDILKKGDIIDVKIIDADRETNKISLSIKELTEEPWKTVEAKYPEGSVVLGKVARLTAFGAFIELESGVDGLVHISKISHERINNPADVLTVGEEVKALILSVDLENKKIGLSIKDVE